MNKKIIIIFVVAVLLVGGVFTLLSNRKTSPIQSVSPVPVVPIVSATSPIHAATSPPETKTYRNEEWGFEFEYPAGWTFEINSFYNPSSKFNLQGDSSARNYNPFSTAFLVNIVTSDFVERQFSILKKDTSKIIVGGVRGLKYEYKLEKETEVAVILPFGQYKMILGTTKGHEDAFNQILASFKFLKPSTSTDYENASSSQQIEKIDAFTTGRILDIYPRGGKWFIKIHAIQYIGDPGALDGYRTKDLKKEKIFPIITDTPMTLTSDAAYELVETGFMEGDSERPWTIKPVSITKLIPSMEEKGVSWREATFMRQLYHFTFENGEISSLVQQYVP